MSLPPSEWLRHVQTRLDEIENLLNTLESLIKHKERRKSKIIEKDDYTLEITVDTLKDALLVKIYCTPKIKVDPKYLFLIYLTEFFPEISADLLDPSRSKIYTSKIVLTFRMSPEFFEIDMPRILAKIHRFFKNLKRKDIREELDKILPEVYELMKSKDPEARKRLSILKMKVNDLLLYE